MNLSEPQRDAMLRLGDSASGHDFIPPTVLEELLSMKLVYWRAFRDLDFTPAGEQVWKKLVGEKPSSPGAP